MSERKQPQVPQLNLGGFGKQHNANQCQKPGYIKDQQITQISYFTQNKPQPGNITRNPCEQKGMMPNMDPRKMQQYEQMQEEEGSDYDEESGDSGDDDIGLMQQRNPGQPQPRPGRAAKAQSKRQQEDFIEMQDQFQDGRSNRSEAKRRAQKQKDDYYDEVGELGDQMRALGSGGDIEQHHSKNKSLHKKQSKVSRGSQKSRPSKQSRESGKAQNRMPINSNNFNQMQNALNLDETYDERNTAINSARRAMNQQAAAPELKDSKYQKQFTLSFEDFDSRLVLALVVTLVALCIGLLGNYLTKSPTLLNLSLVAVFLCINWPIGFLLSNKVKKELNRIHFRHLNGSGAFEMLIVYAQGQIILAVGLFIFLIQACMSVFTESRELEMLFFKQDGALWEREFSFISLSSVEVQLVVLFFLQLLLFILVIAIMVQTVNSGLRWGDHQQQSRSKGFFLTVACIVIPYLAIDLIFEARDHHTFLSELPEVQRQISPVYQLYLCYGIAVVMIMLSIIAFLGTVCHQ